MDGSDWGAWFGLGWMVRLKYTDAMRAEYNTIRARARIIARLRLRLRAGIGVRVRFII